MKKTTLIAGFALISSVATLSACGQKGPLYLPAKPSQTAPTSNQTPAPATPSEETKASK